MAEGREKFSEFTDMSGDNGHSSSGSSRRAAGGCYLSTVIGFVLVLLAIAIAVGVGIIVHFAGARSPIVECNCNYPNNAGNVNSQTGDDKTTIVPQETTLSENEFATQCEAYLDQHMEWCVKCPPSTEPSTTTTPSPEKPLLTDVRLPTALTPLLYDVELTPNMYHGPSELFDFDGSVNILMHANENTDNITLHLLNLTLKNDTIIVHNDETNAVIKHTSYDHDKGRQFAIFHLGQTLMSGNNYSISMKFTGLLKDDLRGFYLSQYKRNNDTISLAITQFQPTDARKAFPCFDEPAIKSKFNIILVRPDNMTSLSNMPIMRNETRGNGFTADVYYTTEKMSTYLVAFVVSDFEYKASQTKNGLVYRAWSRPGSVEQTSYALQVGVDVIEYYEDYFNISFPLPKQDMIASPDLAFGAMENWGLITYKERALLFDPLVSSEANKERVAVIIAHELAHQWFGDLVTPAWWDDLWLNEGFASFVEYMGVDFVEPTWNMFDQFVVDDMHYVFNFDGLKSSHPIYVKVNNPDEINEIFDAISYNKGACIIRMMRYILGGETFRWGLHRYLESRKYGNARHDDLWEALKEQSRISGGGGVDVKQIMDTWTLQMNYPVVHMTARADGNIDISQNRFVLDASAEENIKYTSDYGYQWQIPITYTTSLSPNFQQSGSVHMLNIGAETITGVNVSTSANSWILGNVQQYGYYRVNYEQSNWLSLIQQLSSNHLVIHAINRAQIINDAWNLAKADLLDMMTALSTLEYLAQEREHGPWTAATRELSHVRLMFARDQVYGSFSKFMKKTITPLFQYYGWQNTPTTPHVEIKMRAKMAGLACNYDVAECTNNATNDFAMWMANPLVNNVDVNMKAVTYCNAISGGGLAEWQFAYDQYQATQIASEQSALLASLACSNEPWILSSLLRLSIQPDKIRKQDAVSTINAVAANPVGMSLAWDFLREQWAYLRANYGGGFFSFASLIKGVTAGFNTDFDLEQLTDFVTSHPDLGSGKRAFEQAIEETNGNIKWMIKYKDTIAQWLDGQSP